MSKPNKNKKMSFGKKALVVTGCVGLIGAGLYGIGAFDKAPVVQETTQTTLGTSKAPVTITTFNVATDVKIADQKILVTSKVGNVDFIVTSGVSEESMFVVGETYSAMPLDYMAMGSDAVVGEDISGVTVGEAFTFTVPAVGFNLDLGVNELGTFSIKGEDNENGVDLELNGFEAYNGDEVIVVSATAGAVIPLDEVLDLTLTIKATEKDKIVNDLGTLVVASVSNDEFEDFGLSFGTNALVQISNEKLESDYAKVTYDAFKNKKVFLIKDSSLMERNVEQTLGITATKMDGVNVTRDIVIETFALGNIETTNGAELSALKSDATNLHTMGHKEITLNLI